MPIDHRSDLYSLGVTFYHMLAGVPPFHAETALALALKQVREIPRSMLDSSPRPAARARPAGPQADGQGSGGSLPIGRRDARGPGENPRFASDRARPAVIPDAYTGGSAARLDELGAASLRARETVEDQGGHSPRPRTAAVRPPSMVKPVWNALSRLSPAALIATCAACLLVGALFPAS